MTKSSTFALGLRGFFGVPIIIIFDEGKLHFKILHA